MGPIALLKTLVETESPSHEKAAVDRVGAIVAEEVQSLGAQIEIIPNHGCTTINLHDNYHVIRNGRLEAIWPIAARGKVM